MWYHCPGHFAPPVCDVWNRLNIAPFDCPVLSQSLCCFHFQCLPAFISKPTSCDLSFKVSQFSYSATQRYYLRMRLFVLICTHWYDSGLSVVLCVVPCWTVLEQINHHVGGPAVSVRLPCILSSWKKYQSIPNQSTPYLCHFSVNYKDLLSRYWWNKIMPTPRNLKY